MEINTKTFTVKVKITENQKTMKAIVGLDFGDFVIKGFRIMDSVHEDHRGYKLWVVAPSYRGGGGYHPMFFAPNKELWVKIQDKIIDAYKVEDTRYWAKRIGLGKDDIDSIEF